MFIHDDARDAPNYGGRVPVDTTPGPVPVYRALKNPPRNSSNHGAKTLSMSCNCGQTTVYPTRQQACSTKNTTCTMTLMSTTSSKNWTPRQPQDPSPPSRRNSVKNPNAVHVSTVEPSMAMNTVTRVHPHVGYVSFFKSSVD